MEIYPATSLNTKHCVYNTISFSKIIYITNTVTEMPNTVFGKWTCRPVTFVDFLQWYVIFALLQVHLESMEVSQSNLNEFLGIWHVPYSYIWISYPDTGILKYGHICPHPPGQNTTPDPGFFSVKEYIQQIVYESSTTDSNIQPVPIYFANLKKLQKFN